MRQLIEHDTVFAQPFHRLLDAEVVGDVLRVLDDVFQDLVVRRTLQQAFGDPGLMPFPTARSLPVSGAGLAQFVLVDGAHGSGEGPPDNGPAFYDRPLFLYVDAVQSLRIRRTKPADAHAAVAALALRPPGLTVTPEVEKGQLVCPLPAAGGEDAFTIVHGNSGRKGLQLLYALHFVDAGDFA
jgi:hypothetical protein